MQTNFVKRRLGWFFVAVFTWILVANGQDARLAVFDVRSFGATGDGKTLDTAAINKAIDAAASLPVFFGLPDLADLSEGA